VRGRVLADRYVLQRPLSAGVSTCVWQAQDRLLQRDVALKFLSNGSDGASGPVDDLVREATTASSLGSPHLIHVFDVVRSSDGAFVVLELAEGPTLRELLTRHGRLPAPVVAAVGSQVATALHAVHSAGVLHGDVKLANILVARPSGMVKLGDFGSAIRAEGSECRGSMLRYVTPERLEGEAPDPTDDLYALGLVLWECVAGRPPFVGETGMASAEMRLAHEPEPLDRVAPSAPDALLQAVTMAVRRRPQGRPAEASQIADRLEALSGHRPWGVTADFLRRDDDTPALDAPPVRLLSTDDEETALRMATVAYSQTLVAHPDAAAVAALAGGRAELVARARDLLSTISAPEATGIAGPRSC
jgi:serine/threonine protein kinase